MSYNDVLKRNYEKYDIGMTQLIRNINLAKIWLFSVKWHFRHTRLDCHSNGQAKQKNHNTLRC